MNTLQVNVTTRVNSASIRREVHNGREHFVIPSYTLPANVVMNGILYPSSEIDRHYKELEGTLAPLGHPKLNGKHVSAFTPEGINVNHIGAWNRNVKKVGNRVYLEKWVDIQVAKAHEKGSKLLERLEAIESGENVDPIHTSVAVFLDPEPVANAEEVGYGAIARFKLIDHDSILLEEPGAATPEQGVGLMVNADLAVGPNKEKDVLEGVTYRDRERMLEEAARGLLTNDDDYVWAADFNDTQVVLIRNGDAEIRSYRMDNGRVILDDAGTPVERRESWIAKIPFANRLIEALSQRGTQATKHQQQEGAEMPITEEERKALVQDMSDAFKTQLAESLRPLGELSEKVTTLETNQKSIQEALTANQRAEESTKRQAIAKVHGEVVANALAGEALEAMYKGLGTSRGLPQGSDTDLKTNSGAPNPDEYFGAEGGA